MLPLSSGWSSGLQSCQAAPTGRHISPQEKSLPFIYKLLEVLCENSIGQLGRWLRRKGEGSSVC